MILIIGGGFGGAYCAQALAKRLGGDSARIHLIDRRNYSVFYPSLVEAGTGSLEPREFVQLSAHRKPGGGELGNGRSQKC